MTEEKDDSRLKLTALAFTVLTVIVPLLGLAYVFGYRECLGMRAACPPAATDTE